MVLESHGMAPIPEEQRYGASWRNFTVWFAPNMELSGIFTGTLAFTIGLGFWLGLIAIALGVVLGSLPVALLATWGPKTGMGQLPLARLPFGKTIALPAAVQWLSSVAWDALVGLFGIRVHPSTREVGERRSRGALCSAVGEDPPAWQHPDRQHGTGRCSGRRLHPDDHHRLQWRFELGDLC